MFSFLKQLFSKQTAVLSKINETQDRGENTLRKPIRWQIVKTINNEAKDRRLEIMTDGTGLCRFYSEHWLGPWEEDGVGLDEGFWSCGLSSGLFDNLDNCEAEARASIPWVREL